MHMTFEEAKEIVLSDPCSKRFVCDACPIGKVAHREGVVCEEAEYAACNIIRETLDDRCPHETEDVLPTGDAPSLPAAADNTSTAADSVNHPAHYTQGGIECIDAIEAATAGRPRRLSEDEAMSLYNKGLTDKQIAHLTGTYFKTVANWRYRHGLPAHKKRNVRAEA